MISLLIFCTYVLHIICSESLFIKNRFKRITLTACGSEFLNMDVVYNG